MRSKEGGTKFVSNSCAELICTEDLLQIYQTKRAMAKEPSIGTSMDVVQLPLSVPVRAALRRVAAARPLRLSATTVGRGGPEAFDKRNL